MSIHLNKKYLIIAGSTKCGTGSLFNYLSDHPSVCGSNLKETRYFFESNRYSLPARYSFKRSQLENYYSYFNHCENLPYRLEATPDYLYSPSAPKDIKTSLSDVKIIFILRNPIDRLVSWYQFAIQQDLIPTSMGFDDYVNIQFENLSNGEDYTAKQHMHSLEQGRYSEFIRNFYDTFRPRDICIIRSEDLKQDPIKSLTKISQFSGLDPTYYHQYRFHMYNRTRTMRSSKFHRYYVGIRRNVRLRIHNKKFIRNILRTIRRNFDLFYYHLNTSEKKNVFVSESLKTRLKDFYTEEPQKLADLISEGHPLWQL
jgi:hypothetical protein